MPESIASSRLSLPLREFGFVTLRLLGHDKVAEEAFRSVGLPWIDKPGDLAADEYGTLVVWRTPRERLVLAPSRKMLEGVLEAFDPANGLGIVAVDLSEALAAIELDHEGAGMAISSLADESSLPAAGRASVCRFADVPVMLVRPDASRWWLVVERPLLPHVNHWLAFVEETSGGWPMA